jgi:hypothetical protein
MLEGTVKTPFGTASKKTVALIGGGGLLVVGVVWYRTKKAGGSSATSGTSSSTATDNIDPATGYAYGSPEDQAALASQSSGYPAYGGGYGYGGGSGIPPSQNGQGIAGEGPGGFTSNANWAQYAEEYLANTVGADPIVVGNALGKYITGQAVTAEQAQVIDQAIAFAGYPPVAGPNNHPPAINISQNGGGGGGNTVTVPNVTKHTYIQAATILKANHLVPRKDTPNIHIVTSQLPKAGDKVKKDTVIHLAGVGR